MKKATLLCGMLLALVATVASAAPGTNLRWISCYGDGGAQNRVFACNTNAGASNTLVGSIELGVPIVGASGHEIVMDFGSASPTLPAWWQMRNTGTCRPTALGFNTVPPGTANICVDWGQGQANGGIGAYNIGTNGGPNTARLVAATAVPQTALQDLFPGQEYFICNVTINNLKTVGTPVCDGCLVPVCIVFNSNKVTTPIAANDRIISGATNDTDSNFALWQGGAGVTSLRGQGCPAATPSRNATWGTVKSLYR